ncbi:MAG: hypothetical protein WC630_04710 [Candidatus Babeliales bacterium]
MIRTQITRVLWFCFSIIVFHNDVVLSSLLEGTLVATAHGLVPIQNLKVGDKVLGYDLNAPSYDEALCEVAVTKINKHLTESLFTICTKDGWVEASPHQLIFTLIPEEPQNGDACVMDFVQAQDITKSCMLIDAHMNCLAIEETNRLNLSCSYPEQYIEKVKRNRHKKVTKVVRLIVNADVYALEVEEPHVFLIAENPHATDMSRTRLFLTHNGIPALAVGVSMAFDATPASLAFAEATATVGGMGVIFGPVGLTLGVLTSVGFLGYQLFKSDANKQSSFYIERAGQSSPGGMDPKEPKDKKDEKIRAQKEFRINTTDPNNVNAKENLTRKFGKLEKAQETAVRSETLPDGRIRYYEKERLARTAGKTRGNAHVTEYNPKTGEVRSWEESYDHKGDVTRVHPKTIDGQVLESQHYPPTGAEK